MKFTFKKAARSASKLRLAISGASGSGKTSSALLLAKGIGGRIAVIDTGARLRLSVCGHGRDARVRRARA